MGSRDSERLISSKYIFALRIAVTAGLFAAAFTFGILSYFTLAHFEDSSAVERFHNTAHYARSTLANDFQEKQNVILGMAKNMAYLKPNSSEWPYVTMPGFYDTAPPLRDSSNLDDIFFAPIVKEEQLLTFTTFLYDYFASEPAIGAGAGIPALGVFSVGPDGPYHETTGETLIYDSPYRLIAPLTQVLFTQYSTRSTLATNMHSLSEVGPAMDSIIECSKLYNYTQAATACVDVIKIASFPFDATPENVEDFHTAFLEPIYLGLNTSALVGFVGGGFNWKRVLSKVLSDSVEGVQVIVRNSNITLTFEKTRGPVVFKGYGDLHDRNHNSLEHSITLYAAPDGSSDHSTYKISFYPNAKYYSHFRTNNPIYAAVASFLALAGCAAIFFLYDAYVRGESEANAMVLETKRRFVRFISHEIRTPLNAVHLGLEALTAEVSKVLDQILSPQRDSVQCKDPTHCVAMLRSWLELSSEMMGNSESAVDVLNDLLNYDKIEMGTLYLDFSSVAIWEVVQTNATVFHNQVKQKNIHWCVSNDLHQGSEDLEQQDNSKFVVVGDSARLAQVMRNLFSNALKFTPNEGSITVHVERLEDGLVEINPAVPDECSHLLDQSRAGSIRISVTDSGAGLSEAQLAKICSEGVQFNANELQAGKGSGLGLFITKGIVEQHGGTLTVTSTGLGAGTTFAVELPLFIREKSPPETWEEPLRVVADSPKAVLSIDTSLSSEREVISPTPTNRFDFESTPRSSSLRIVPPAITSVCEPTPSNIVPTPIRRVLVVDDAASNRKMLMRILTSKGYTCEQAEDGQQAIDVYRAAVEAGNEFYAITMDFEMPVMNGPTATGHLRAMGCTVPIIGVTGNLLPDDIKYFKAQGATDVIGKPVSLSKFESLMREHDSGSL